jgi:tetratricopeptide (TPR) repeat protein
MNPLDQSVPPAIPQASIREDIRMRGLGCSAIALVAICLVPYANAQERQLPPQPADAVVVPGCRMKDYFPERTRKTLALAEKSGDIRRMMDAMRLPRGLLDAMVADDPAIAAKLGPVFDIYFSDAMLRDRARCEFVGGMVEERIPVWEAWIEDPAMLRIHDLIMGQPQRKAATGAPDKARLSLLVRLAHAMHADDILGGRRREVEFLMAAVEDARDPASSALAGFRQSRYWRGPGEEAFATQWLAPVLKDVSDDDLARFLVFAEGIAGQSYYPRFGLVHSHDLMSTWHADFAKAVAVALPKATATASPAEADAMFAEAKALYRSGSARAYDQAKRLLLRAEAIKPKDAQIQLYLGLVSMTMREAELPDFVDLRKDAKPDHFAEAETHLRSAIALDPTQALAYLALGRARYLLKDDSEAARLYALAREHRCACARLDLYEGDLFAAKDDRVAAVAAYRKALDNPESSGATRKTAFEKLAGIAFDDKTAVDLRAVGDAYLARNPGDMLVGATYVSYLMNQQRDFAAALRIIDGASDDDGMVEWRAFALSGLAQQGADRRGNLGGKHADLMREAIALVGAKNLARIHCLSPSDAGTFRSIVRFSGEPEATATYSLGCLIMTKNVPAVVAMIAMGADVNAMSGYPDPEMPLCQAMLSRSPEAFKALLDANADPARKCSDGRDVRDKIDWLRRDDKDVEAMARMLGEASTP